MTPNHGGNTSEKDNKMYDPTITVCSRCLRACCWQYFQGKLMWIPLAGCPKHD